MRINGFSISPAALLADRSLSDGDKILYTIIAGTVDFEQKVREDIDGLAKFKGTDERTIRRHITTLTERGWLHRRKIEGDFYLYVITNRSVGDSNTDVVIDTTKAILARWNDFWGSKLIYTTSVERLIRRRLKEFTPEQLMRATNGRIAFVVGNTWFNRDENRHLKTRIENVFESKESVEKYINQPVGEEVLDHSVERAKLKAPDNKVERVVLG